MTRHVLALTLFSLVWATPIARGQSPLPVVEDVEAGPFRRHCEKLQSSLAGLISAEDYAALRRLIRMEESAADFSERVQEILDRYCLVGVSINPESRVKAARGPREAELVRGRETLVLARVQNEAGVTQGLKIAGDQLRTAKDAGKGRWLEAVVETRKPLEDKLTGQKLEYVVLRLKAHEAGKREATLKFDVGQGTQDLGFRAEVPILFLVKEKD